MKIYRYMIITLVVLCVVAFVFAFVTASINQFNRFTEISRKDVGHIKNVNFTEYCIIETEAGYFALDEPISAMKDESLYISNRKNGSKYLCDKDDKQCKKIQDNR